MSSSRTVAATLPALLTGPYTGPPPPTTAAASANGTGASATGGGAIPWTRGGSTASTSVPPSTLRPGAAASGDRAGESVTQTDGLYTWTQEPPTAAVEPEWDLGVPDMTNDTWNNFTVTTQSDAWPGGSDHPPLPVSPTILASDSGGTTWTRSAQGHPWPAVTHTPLNITLEYNPWMLNVSLEPASNETNFNSSGAPPGPTPPDGYLSGYTLENVIIVSIFVTVLMLVIVIGNGLVIVAIAKDRNLKGLQNWFIASLAVSDLLVGLLIMPLSLANELMGYWYFGNVLCELWLATDVLLCTASILNLCLISLDRYWSITRAISYVKTRTKKRAIIMITLVWLLSMIICFPPLVGWKRPQPTMFGLPLCVLSEDIGYVVYSTLGSFYIPLLVMVVVYLKIYIAARSRARRGLKTQKARPVVGNGKSMSTTTTTTTTSFSNTAKIPEEVKDDIDELCSDEPEEPRPSPDPSAVTSTEEGEADRGIKLTSVANPHAHFRPIDEKKKLLSEDTDSACDSPIRTMHAKNAKNHRRIHFSEDTDSTSDTSYPQARHSNYRGRDKGSNEENMKPLLEDSQMESDSQRDSDKCSAQNNNLDPDGEDGQGAGKPPQGRTAAENKPEKPKDLAVPGENKQEEKKRKVLLLSPSTFRRVSQNVRKTTTTSKEKHKKNHDDPLKNKKKIARAKERRATIVLGIIMATFILCWFPFFSSYVISSVTGLPVPEVVFDIFFWAGYCNSALNPIIYTIFNRDFRHAFQRIVFGRRHM